jgi:hypothetical protein
MAETPPAASEAPRRRRRERAIAVVTLLVAAAWAYGTYRAAEHVRQANRTRMVAAIFTGGDRTGGASGQSPLQNLLAGSRRPARYATAPATAPASSFQKNTAWVEGVVHYWKRTTYAVAIGLALTGLLSFATRGGRVLHLTAAIVILLATVGTLICLWMLMAPHLGDLPPLSKWTFVAVGGVQSAYGWFLLAAFAKRTHGRPLKSAS